MPIRMQLLELRKMKLRTAVSGTSSGADNVEATVLEGEDKELQARRGGKIIWIFCFIYLYWRMHLNLVVLLLQHS